MKSMKSYQNGDSHEYGAVPKIYTSATDDDDNDVVIESGSPFQTKRRLFVTGALGLWIALAGVVKIFNSNSPLTMDVLLPNGLHDVSADHLTPQWLDQIVDHFDEDKKNTFPQKYMTFEKFWKGPGHPIFLVLGGEDPLDSLISSNVYYYYGKHFGAATIGVEHRYFGDSYPVEEYTHEDLQRLMTPMQAVEDFAAAATFYRNKLGCSPDKSSKHYCPVITVAGSYPGFLSAMMRLSHPHVVDIAYATSAPLHLYSHQVDDRTYYDYVTMVADAAVPGCAAAVKKTTREFHDWAVATDDGLSLDEKAGQVKICPDGGIPKYIVESEDPVGLWWQEVNEIITAHFAEANMGYYPPGPDAQLEKACRIFLEEGDSMQDKIGNMLTMRKEWELTGCFDMHSELPVGKDARISASDWSGMGDGINAYMWEFLSCQLLPSLTQSEESMFYPRQWTLEWVGAHCKRRFDMNVDPNRLKEYFGFEDLTGVEHLLFVNNINDGWSSASVTVPPPHTGIEVINVVNGAHCSDFRGGPKADFDTPEMRRAHQQIQDTIGKWLDEIKAGSKGVVGSS